MGNYPIGRLIAEARSRRGLSQEELSGGICAPSTLSKIENGMQMPSRRVYLALLERLGLSHRSCLMFVSHVDMRRSTLEEELGRLIAGAEYPLAYQALEEYLSCGEPGKGDTEECLLALSRRLGLRSAPAGWEAEVPLAEMVLCELLKQEDKAHEAGLALLELQYALGTLGVLLWRGKGQKGRALELLSAALRLTMNTFPEHLETARFFSQEELGLLFQFAVLSYELEEVVEAKRILFLLRDYMEGQWVDAEVRADMYPAILYYLSEWMGKDQRRDRQLEFCDLGIALCIQYGRLAMLPQLLSVKGCVLAACGQRRQAEPILKQAHLILQMIGDSAGAEALREQVGELFFLE